MMAGSSNVVYQGFVCLRALAQTKIKAEQWSHQIDIMVYHPNMHGSDTGHQSRHNRVNEILSQLLNSNGAYALRSHRQRIRRRRGRCIASDTTFPQHIRIAVGLKVDRKGGSL